MKRLLLPILLAVIPVTGLAQEAQERTSRIGRISKTSATTTGDRGMFTVSSVDTLNPRQLSFGVAWENLDRTPRDLDINVVPIFASFGLSDRLTFTATLEVHKEVVARNLGQQGFYNSLPFVDNRYRSGSGDAMPRNRR
jgi:hypothetical protein